MNYHSHLKIGLSPNRGRGVFSRYQFDVGLVCDRTNSWLLSPEDISKIDTTSISGFWFCHPKIVGWGLLPLGFAALINHSSSPNAELNWFNTPIGYVGELRCLKVIPANDEIFIDYDIDPPRDWI